MTTPGDNLAPRGGGEDIAIVGMSCLLPGADSPARFWQNIVHKVDAISDAPPDWQPEFFYDPAGPEIDRSYTKRGGFLRDLCRFHPPKYGVPPKDVDGAEPDQFVALRCAYEALADAGYPEVPIRRETTGVILGRGIFVNRGWVAVFQRTLAVEQTIDVLKQLEPERDPADFDLIRRELKKRLPPANADTFPGLVHSALVGRIANRLDLSGPAYTIDAACSSTLLAVEHGIRELRAGRCDAVLVGGTQVSAPAPIHIMFCHLHALSREGLIAPFSAQAHGTVLGQGCGILVLKRQSDAERNGNRIYALLKAAGVSSDGRGAGLLAPRTEGQQLAIRRAYAEAGLTPDSVHLVEAHGTGIPLGDAVEIHSLNTCFGLRTGAHADVALGSVKSMIGHLVPASGVASLIKTALALHHRVLPPTLRAETPNPALELEKTRFFLCNEARPWVHGDPSAPRRAGVNAFGFGGINAHVLLEEYRGDESRGPDMERDWPCELVVVSADNQAALAARAGRLSTWIKQSAGLTLLDVAAACARLPGASRLAIVARDLDDLVKKLDKAGPLLADPARRQIQDRSGVYWYAEPLAAAGRVAFVFPGEGSQYPNMLAELCRHFPEVRREFDLTSRAFEARGQSFGRIVFPQPAWAADAERELFDMDKAVASVTAAARGLWRLLRTFGVEADAVVGHSSGEYAALLAAGAYRHEDDDAMVHAVMAGIESALELKGASVLPSSVLVSVGGVPEATLAAEMAELGSDVEIAMDNCPHQRILVGGEEPMDRLLKKLQGRGGLCQRLPWDRPYHTAAFAPASPIVARYFDSLELAAPRVDLWSCATAAPMPREAAAVRELAVRQWSSPVRFRETILAMHEAGVRVFLECGPRNNLSAFIADTLNGQPHAAVPLDVPNRGGLDSLCRALGALAAHGVALKLEELFRRRRPQPLDLDGPAFRGAPAEPRLPLELPLLEVTPEAAQRWNEGRPKAAAPPGVTKVEDVPPYGESTERPARFSPDYLAPQTEPTAPAIDSSIAAAAHREFQATMQRFLQTQVEVAALRSPEPVRFPPQGGSYGEGANGASHGPSAEGSATAVLTRREAAPRPVASAAPRPAQQSAPRRTPFIETVLEDVPGERFAFECELRVDRHRFLRDHTFFGGPVSQRDPQLTALPIMPLAMSLELLCEAATRLCPQQSIVALSQIRVSNWLPFAGVSRRVRAVAEVRPDGDIDAQLVEADGDGRPEIAAARIELGHLPQDLGAGRLPRLQQRPAPWKAADLYGRILYHGEAFRGLEGVEDWGAAGVRARVRQPDPRLLLDGDDARQWSLPVALTDTASQVPGLVNGDLDSAEVYRTFAFPNEIARLEFSRAAFESPTFTALSTLEQSGGKVISDTELLTPDGRAALRYLGKVEEAVDFPLSVYRYGPEANPADERSLDALFGGVPGADRVAIREASASGHRLWAKSLWARVLAYLILDARERGEYNRLKLPPVAAADWLLGRMAVKEAVRARLGQSLYLADIPIAHDDFGAPLAAMPGIEPLRVSLAHKTLRAVGVAGLASDFDGLGIDCEPLQALPPDVAADAFTPAERQRLAAAGASAEFERAAWSAKEAVGKALGRGVQGGPQCIVIDAAPAAEQRFTLTLAGAMADAFPAHRQGAAPLTVHWREHEGYVVALCLRKKS